VQTTAAARLLWDVLLCTAAWLCDAGTAFTTFNPTYVRYTLLPPLQDKLEAVQSMSRTAGAIDCHLQTPNRVILTLLHPILLPLQDKLETLKFMAAHNVSKDKMLAAEITRPVAGGDVTFHLGIARRMENGALLKTKVGTCICCSCLVAKRACIQQLVAALSGRRMRNDCFWFLVQKCYMWLLAAEITRPVAGGDVTFHLGIARLASAVTNLLHSCFWATLCLQLQWLQVDHKGTLSALYEQRLSTGEKFVLSTQLDTLNIGGKAPKVGFALDLA
jgi:hypothetical protein